jgi:hypothetical protein
VSAGPLVAAGAARGATIVEVLVALTVLMLAVSSVAVLATAVVGAFEADPAAADAQQRARGGVLALLDDIRQSGSGFLGAPELGPGHALPAVWPDIVPASPAALGAQPRTLTAWHSPRGAAHGVLRVDAPPGTSRLSLVRQAFCAAVTPTCGFEAGDDVVVYGAHGRLAIAEVTQVLPPLELELATPLPDPWPAGSFVAAVRAHTYELRADAATGLSQITRRRGPGPAMPVIDFVTRFDVEWVVGDSTPRVEVTPGGVEEDASAGPAPPPVGLVSDPSWPAGENCAFARDAMGVPQWRGSAGLTGAASLGAFVDGPWCPSPVAAVRWDVDLSRVMAVRIVVGVAAAANELRPAPGLGLTRRPGARLVPDLVLETTIRPGRVNGGA